MKIPLRPVGLDRGEFKNFYLLWIYPRPNPLHPLLCHESLARIERWREPGAREISAIAISALIVQTRPIMRSGHGVVSRERILKY